jgi:hypothetical protein
MYEMVYCVCICNLLPPVSTKQENNVSKTKGIQVYRCIG